MKLSVDLNDLGLPEYKVEELYPLGEMTYYDIEEPVKRSEEGGEPEDSFIYVKEFDCPLCGKKAANPIAKIAKLRPLGTEKDLRTRYKYFEPLKYDVLCCEGCGYAAIQTNFKPLAKPHKLLLDEKIRRPFQPGILKTGVLSFEDAILRYKRAITCSKVRLGKNGEIASLCLRMAWLLRSYSEWVTEESLVQEIKQEEIKYLAAAREGLVLARQKEGSVPGMPDLTVDYLIGILSMKLGYFQDAQKLFMAVIGNGMAAASQKDKARDRLAEVKEMLKNSL